MRNKCKVWSGLKRSLLDNKKGFSQTMLIYFNIILTGAGVGANNVISNVIGIFDDVLWCSCITCQGIYYFFLIEDRKLINYPTQSL